MRAINKTTNLKFCTLIFVFFQFFIDMQRCEHINMPRNKQLTESSQTGRACVTSPCTPEAHQVPPFQLLFTF